LSVPPRHAGLHQLLIQAPAIGQQHLTHHATIAVCVADNYGDSLLEDEIPGKLPRLRAECLPFFGRIDAMQSHLDRLALA
jgi:hypothetical protein